MVELVVVMAVMAIMVAMVVTFTMMCNAWSHWGTNRYDLTVSERQADAFLRTFVSVYDTADYTFAVKDGRLLAIRIGDSTEQHYFYQTESGELEFDTTAGVGYCPMDFVTNVRFEVYTKDNGRQLVHMSLHYSLPNMGVGTSQEVGIYDVLVSTRTAGVAA